MVDTKLSDLPEVTTVATTDEIYVNASGTSSRIVINNLADEILAEKTADSVRFAGLQDSSGNQVFTMGSGDISFNNNASFDAVAGTVTFDHDTDTGNERTLLQVNKDGTPEWFIRHDYDLTDLIVEDDGNSEILRFVQNGVLYFRNTSLAIEGRTLNRPSSGTSLLIEYDVDTDNAVIRSRDWSTPVDKDLHIIGDLIQFQTSTGGPGTDIAMTLQGANVDIPNGKLAITSPPSLDGLNTAIEIDNGGNTAGIQLRDNNTIDISIYRTTSGDFRITRGAGFNRIIDVDTSNNITMPNGNLSVTNGGVVVGSPTGGNQGVGTINAEAVYDDGSLLTDYVFDAEIDGAIDTAYYDQQLPNKTRMVDGQETVIEREHKPAKQFDNSELDPARFSQKWRNDRKLPAIARKNEKPSIGELAQALLETCEVQAVHIAKLEERIRALENQ